MGATVRDRTGRPRGYVPGRLSFQVLHQPGRRVFPASPGLLIRPTEFLQYVLTVRSVRQYPVRSARPVKVLPGCSVKPYRLRCFSSRTARRRYHRVRVGRRNHSETAYSYLSADGKMVTGLVQVKATDLGHSRGICRHPPQNRSETFAETCVPGVRHTGRAGL